MGVYGFAAAVDLRNKMLAKLHCYFGHSCLLVSISSSSCYLIVHNFLTFCRNRFWTPSFSTAGKSTIPTLNSFNAQATTLSKCSILVLPLFSSFPLRLNKSAKIVAANLEIFDTTSWTLSKSMATIAMVFLALTERFSKQTP